MKKIKLNVLAEKNLSELEMNQVRGGGGCGCSCYYADNGGSSSGDNGSANNKAGLSSPKGKNELYVTP